MTITLGSSTLCAGQTRNSLGNPVGPANLRLTDQPGVVKHDYVGADRTTPEHIQCDHGTLTFDVTRVFADVASALAYIASGYRSEAREGALKFDNTTVFSKAAVTNCILAHVGTAVSISYTIEG